MPNCSPTRARPGHRQLQVRILEQILDQTHGPVTKLDRILRRRWHDATLPRDRRLHQTRGRSTTGELLRELTIDSSKDYQPRK
jgi:hypothetical protein